MTRKRKSVILDKAQRRLNGLRYLNPSIDLGNGINVRTFATLTEELRGKLEAYNALIDLLDERRAEIEVLEDKLSPQAERMLNTVAALYGKDSDEYEIAGGSKRVRQPSSPKPSPDTPASSADLLMLNLPLVPQNGTKNGATNGNSTID